MMKSMKNVLFVLLCIFIAAVVFFSSFVITIIKIFDDARAPWKIDWNDSMGTVYYDIDLNEAEQTGYDLYVPTKTSDKNYSLILYIHGGGFTGGDKSDGDYLCKYYTAQGYVCASVNYTLADGEHNSNINLIYEQIRNQVMSIKEKTEELGYCITEMATTGESAGGCLAMLYAYRDPDESPIPIKFVFQMSGPSTFIPELLGATDTESAANFVTMMYGETVTPEMIESGEVSKLIDKISPAAYVNETTVPTIIAYGSKDKVVPTSLKEQLIQAFDEYSVTYNFIEFPNSGHTMALDTDKTQAYFEAIEEYLKLYFEN